MIKSVVKIVVKQNNTDGSGVVSRHLHSINYASSVLMTEGAFFCCKPELFQAFIFNLIQGLSRYCDNVKQAFSKKNCGKFVVRLASKGQVFFINQEAL